MLPINMQRGGKVSRYKNPEYDHRRTHYSKSLPQGPDQASTACSEYQAEIKKSPVLSHALKALNPKL